jgi:hypothetical protein
MFFLGICILSGYLMFNVDSLKLESNIISKFEDSGEYNYIIKDGKSYSIKSYEKEVRSTDGKLHYEELHPVAAVSFIVFLVISIVIFIVTLTSIDNDEVGWQISESWIEAKLSLVKCELEDDVYYYHYRGKLLVKSEQQLSSSQIQNRLTAHLNLLPDFPSTKKERRDKKLKELFDEN